MAVPSDAHLLAFGRIMHAFAAVESGIKIALSGILEIDLAHALIAFEPYGATDVKNVAKSLAKERLKPHLADQFSTIVGEWAGHGSLRNSIAHSRWTDGDRPGSIKPRGVYIREGHARFSGDDSDEKSYTARELNAVLTQLDSTNERLKRFLKKSGLEQIIEAKMADDNASMSGASGSDGKHSDK